MTIVVKLVMTPFIFLVGMLVLPFWLVYEFWKE